MLSDQSAEDLTVRMRSSARILFEQAMTESSIQRAFGRHVHCERGVLRLGDDLYDLSSYVRVFVVAIGKAAHTMVHALQMQAGDRFEGIIATCIDPGPQ